MKNTRKRESEVEMLWKEFIETSSYCNTLHPLARQALSRSYKTIRAFSHIKDSSEFDLMSQFVKWQLNGIISGGG